MEYSTSGVYFVVVNETEFTKAFSLEAATLGTKGDGCSRSVTKDGNIIIKDRKLGGLVKADEEGNVPVAASIEDWERVKKMAELERLGYVKSYAADIAELKALMARETEVIK